MYHAGSCVVNECQTVIFIPKIVENSFTVRVIVSKWNSLPADVVNAPSVDAFKNCLDKFWFNQEVRFNYKAQFDY